MAKILFICSGNVGRSQMAEGFYNTLTHSLDAISAGVDPTTPGKYPKLPIEVVEVMREEGINVSEKKVKYINQNIVSDIEKIYVLCNKKLCPEFLQQSSKVSYWDIEDPYDTSMDNFRKIRDQIKNKIYQLISR